MDHFLRRFLRIYQQQDPQALLQAARHIDLPGAQQGDVGPAQLARRHRRKLGIEVFGSGENSTGYLILVQFVAIDEQSQQFLAGIENVFAGVLFDSSGSTDAAAAHKRFFPGPFTRLIHARQRAPAKHANNVSQAGPPVVPAVFRPDLPVAVG